MGSLGSGEFLIDLPALPERVWEAMEKPAKAAGWLYDDASASVGSRFALPAGPHRVVIFQVVDVQAPALVRFEGRTTDRSGSHVDGPAIGMTWTVSPAPRGSAIRVQFEPSQAVAQETIDEVRVLLSDRLRAALRSRAVLAATPVPSAPQPVPSPPPAPSPPSPVPSPLPVPPVGGAPAPRPRDPDPGLALVGYETPAGGVSQPISVFPAVPTRPAPGERRRRLLGLALPVWLLAAALCAVGGVVTAALFPSILPWSGTPEQSTPDDPQAGGAASPGVGIIGSGSATPDPGPGPATVSEPSGSASPSASVSGSESAAPGVAPLQVALVNQQLLGVGGLSVLGYRVTITIRNPDEFAQAWTNASFQVPAGGLTLTAGGGILATASDTTVCVTPTGPTDGPPRMVPGNGGSVTVQVDVTRLLYTGDPPHDARLDDSDCDD